MTMKVTYGLTASQGRNQGSEQVLPPPFAGDVFGSFCWCVTRWGSLVQTSPASLDSLPPSNIVAAAAAHVPRRLSVDLSLPEDLRLCGVCPPLRDQSKQRSKIKYWK
ncbi:unnamed protein product [Cuscuta epithymum]|uniref:Uncharacterized protein n=1 Tax=Cuscuta epithymum TaxID=186058 RepID=A0AAV0EQX8_9ASTE|nr:unnamed protein product [Cuscuta epithymum]